MQYRPGQQGRMLGSGLVGEGLPRMCEDLGAIPSKRETEMKEMGPEKDRGDKDTETEERDKQRDKARQSDRERRGEKGRLREGREDEGRGEKGGKEWSYRARYGLEA